MATEFKQQVQQVFEQIDTYAKQAVDTLHENTQKQLNDIDVQYQEALKNLTQDLQNQTLQGINADSSYADIQNAMAVVQEDYNKKLADLKDRFDKQKYAVNVQAENFEKQFSVHAMDEKVKRADKAVAEMLKEAKSTPDEMKEAYTAYQNLRQELEALKNGKPKDIPAEEKTAADTRAELLHKMDEDVLETIVDNVTEVADTTTTKLKKTENKEEKKGILKAVTGWFQSLHNAYLAKKIARLELNFDLASEDLQHGINIKERYDQAGIANRLEYKKLQKYIDASENRLTSAQKALFNLNIRLQNNQKTQQNVIEKTERLGFDNPPKVVDEIERSRIIADLLNAQPELKTIQQEIKSKVDTGVKPEMKPDIKSELKQSAKQEKQQPSVFQYYATKGEVAFAKKLSGRRQINDNSEVMFVTTKEDALRNVKADGLTLAQYVHTDLIEDKDVVTTAVHQNGLALKFADWTLKKDPQIIAAAIAQNGMAIRYTDQRNLSSNILQMAMQNNGMAFQYLNQNSTVVQDNLKALAVTAILQNENAKKFISGMEQPVQNEIMKQVEVLKADPEKQDARIHSFYQGMMDDLTADQYKKESKEEPAIFARNEKKKGADQFIKNNTRKNNQQRKQNQKQRQQAKTTKSQCGEDR